jgi:hypothetical protein
MTEDIFLWAELDLPSLPPELSNFKSEYSKYHIDIGYGITHIKNNKELVACDLEIKQIIDPIIKLWLKSFLPDAIINPAVMETAIVQSQCNTSTSGTATHIVHSDISRYFALNYILDTGGENVTTSWYQEKNMPLSRLKRLGNKQTDSGAVYYKNLECLGSKIFEKNKWYLIATNILHDVDYIETTRSSISASYVDPNALELFKPRILSRN